MALVGPFSGPRLPAPQKHPVWAKSPACYIDPKHELISPNTLICHPFSPTRRVVRLGVVAVLTGAVTLLSTGPSWGQATATTATAGPTSIHLKLRPDDLATASVQELSRTLTLSGSLQASRSAWVKARTAGEVKSITVREGDTVRSGQVLVEQDAEDARLRWVQAEQQRQAAQAQLDIAQRQLSNSQGLVQQGFVSATALETAQANVQAAQANVQAALAGVQLAQRGLADAQLKAPMAGTISQRLVQPGERVMVDARILEIIDLGSLELVAAVPAADVVSVRPGQKALLNLEGTDVQVQGRVSRMAPAAATGSRTVAVYLQLERHEGLRQGLFAQGPLQLGQRKTLTVPAGAVRLDRAQSYVLKVQDGRLVSQAVKTGLRGQLRGLGEVLEILDGLQAGDRVVLGHIGASAEGRAVTLP